PCTELDELERAYTRQVLGRLTYPQALAWFAALWAEALALHVDLSGDWQEDIRPDLTLARVLNGLPSGT
ncbi:MAG: hypothetical protein ACREMQ_05065, partial [Longimicrobiales bacterium]